MERIESFQVNKEKKEMALSSSFTALNRFKKGRLGPSVIPSSASRLPSVFKETRDMFQ